MGSAEEVEQAYRRAGERVAAGHLTAHGPARVRAGRAHRGLRAEPRGDGGGCGLPAGPASGPVHLCLLRDYLRQHRGHAIGRPVLAVQDQPADLAVGRRRAGRDPADRGPRERQAALGPGSPADSGDPVGWISLPATSCPGAAPARSTYEFLASLPTDPGRLRAWLYRHPDGQNPSDAQAWTDIGDMLREMLVPPKLAAALYRVAATVPGATVVPRATNAVGRAGVAVSRSGAELIFDPKTYQLIGEGAVLTKPVAGQGPAGTVVASTAQLQEAVVDRLPDVSPSKVEKSGGGVSC